MLTWTGRRRVPRMMTRPYRRPKPRSERRKDRWPRCQVNDCGRMSANFATLDVIKAGQLTPAWKVAGRTKRNWLHLSLVPGPRTSPRRHPQFVMQKRSWRDRRSTFESFTRPHVLRRDKMIYCRSAAFSASSADLDQKAQPEKQGEGEAVQACCRFRPITAVVGGRRE